VWNGYFNTEIFNTIRQKWRWFRSFGPRKSLRRHSVDHRSFDWTSGRPQALLSLRKRGWQYGLDASPGLTGLVPLQGVESVRA